MVSFVETWVINFFLKASVVSVPKGSTETLNSNIQNYIHRFFPILKTCIDVSKCLMADNRHAFMFVCGHLPCDVYKIMHFIARYRGQLKMALCLKLTMVLRYLHQTGLFRAKT